MGAIVTIYQNYMINKLEDELSYSYCLINSSHINHNKYSQTLPALLDLSVYDYRDWGCDILN